MPRRRVTLRRYAYTLQSKATEQRAAGEHLLALQIPFPLAFPDTAAPLYQRLGGLSGAASKTVVGLTVHRGFESLPLRFSA
jgi:hypothetical protein